MYPSKLIILIFTVTLSVGNVRSVCNSKDLSNLTVSVHLTRESPKKVYRDVNLQAFHNYYKLDVLKANIHTICADMFTNKFKELGSLTLINANIHKVEKGAFSEFGRLWHLSLAVNHLTKVETGQFNLPSLRHLYLSNNSIRTIEQGAFNNMPSLEKIYLDRNKILEINSNWFENTPSIKVIHLGYNLITYVPLGAFKNIKPTAHLDDVEYFLDNNSITSINENALPALEGKEVRVDMILHLERNKITDFDVEVFKNLKSLRVLYMNYNNIDCVSDEVLREMRSASLSLYISDNPLSCKCIQELDNLMRFQNLATDLYYNTTLNCPKIGPFVVTGSNPWN